MTIETKLQAAITGYCIIEALVERYVIAMKSENTTNYHKHNKMEHLFSSALYFYVVLLMILFSQAAIFSQVIVLLASLPIRFIFFGGLTNLLGINNHSRSFLYLSNKGIDGYILKLFGKKNGGLIAMLICIAVLIVLNLI